MTEKTKPCCLPSVEYLEPRRMLTASAKLIADLEVGPPSEYQQKDNAWLGNDVYFAADDGTGDVELWKSDGTADGTVRVKDIRSGSQGSQPRDFVTVNGRIMFTAYHNDFGRELWATDGTEAGTVLVRDLAPGSATPSLTSFTPMGDKLYFRRDDELWVTDATDAHTSLVIGRPTEILAPFGEHLFFTTRSAEGKSVLWKSDGSPEGTHQVKTFSRTFSMVSNSRYLFLAADGGEGPRLWASDGTEEGTKLMSLPPDPTQLTVVDDVLYCEAHGRLCRSDGTDEGTFLVRPVGTGMGPLTVVGKQFFFTNWGQLWRSDGTREGTLQLGEFGDDGSFFSENPWADDLTPVGDKLFFIVGEELWQSDGTEEGTVPVAGIVDPRQLRAADGLLYVLGTRDDVGQKLWRTDGTPEGTVPLDFTQGTPGGKSWVMASQDGRTFFWSFGDTAHGLWASKSHAASPSLLNGTIVGPSGGSSIGVPFEVAGNVFFTAQRKLWKFDGVTSQPIAPLSNSAELAVVTDEIYFRVDTETGEPDELWRTNGSHEGTTRIVGRDEHFVEPNGLTSSGNTLYFWAQGTDSQLKLWKVDEGTSQAVVVKDFPGPPRNHNMAGLNGTLFLTIQRSNDAELWRLDDGEAEPTFVRLVPASNVPLVAAKTRIFLNVNGELWRSDGTSEGTYYLAGSAFPYEIVDDDMFFFGFSQETGRELWISDGTVNGTRLVKDIAPGGSSGCGGTSYYDMASVDGTLFFSAVDGEGHRGLWKSDGTEEGTEKVIEGTVKPISGGQRIVYFARGTESGRGSATWGDEIWQSDGTHQGTALIADLNPGPAGSSKYSATRSAAEINGHLYFAGDDGFHGNELWRVPVNLDDGVELAGDYDGDGTVGQMDLHFVVQYWGLPTADVMKSRAGDALNDTIDSDDLVSVVLNWGKSVDTTSTATSGRSVVEPPLDADRAIDAMAETVAGAARDAYHHDIALQPKFPADRFLP